MDVDTLLQVSPVIPVVTLRDVGKALAVAAALQEGGVGIIEVTLRSPASLPCIEQIAREFPAMTVLAGTVCMPAQVGSALAAGAAGLVSPGLTGALAEAVDAARATWLPGVATASEILRGLALGYRRFKLFPANVAGGTPALRAFAGPFPDVRFCPTGGIERDDVRGYLALRNVACVGGSWVASEQLIETGDWAAIRANAEFAATLARPTPVGNG